MISPQSCPICKESLAPEIGLDSPYFPFCSERCKQVDLLRWSQGDYAIVDPLTSDNMPDQDDDEETE